MAPTRFNGFPDEAFAFYERLAADNTRTFWQANRQHYLEAVKGPMEALLAELGEYGPFHVFRPSNDVRFQKNKPPYKEHIGSYGESEGGAGFYVQCSATGLMAAAGYYAMAADQLARFRAALDDPDTGAEIAGLSGALEARGMSLGAIAELKTAPRGFPKDHPRITLLRRKGLMAARSWDRAAWMGTRTALRRVRETWEACAPMNAWLDRHVGPSTLPPEEGFFPR
jgi:uncharacterized protein (TIGR02453 family)